MPRYYFNILKSDGTFVPDYEGLEFEDNYVAKRQAFKSLRDLIADAITDQLRPICFSVEILREDAGVIDRLTTRIDVPPQP